MPSQIIYPKSYQLGPRRSGSVLELEWREHSMHAERGAVVNRRLVLPKSLITQVTIFKIIEGRFFTPREGS